MILVTLGTHPQPMDRLAHPLEEIARAMPSLGPFIAQLGAMRAPHGWVTHRLVPTEMLRRLIKDADIVVTHGGPATISESRATGKVPIVVPRRRDRGEHVDDHQLHYCRRLADAGEILLVEDEKTLVPTVRKYPWLVRQLPASTPHDPTEAISAIRRVSDELMKKNAQRDVRE